MPTSLLPSNDEDEDDDEDEYSNCCSDDEIEFISPNPRTFDLGDDETP
jgi:hypothetical protein